MFAENDHAYMSVCAHAQLHVGLDAAYCPDCRESFSPHTKEYQWAVNRDRTCDIALVHPGEPGSVREQLLCNSDSAPEHLYQPGGLPGSVQDWPRSAPDTVALTSTSGATPKQDWPRSAPDTVAPTFVSGATQESAPDTKHWVEAYSPGRRDKSYFRYVWMRGRKLNHVHIPGGHVRSLAAAERMAEVEQAIDAGKSPEEIINLIKLWRSAKAKRDCCVQ